MKRVASALLLSFGLAVSAGVLAQGPHSSLTAAEAKERGGLERINQLELNQGESTGVLNGDIASKRISLEGKDQLGGENQLKRTNGELSETLNFDLAVQQAGLEAVDQIERTNQLELTKNGMPETLDGNLARERTSLEGEKRLAPRNRILEGFSEN